MWSWNERCHGENPICFDIALFHNRIISDNVGAVGNRPYGVFYNTVEIVLITNNVVME